MRDEERWKMARAFYVNLAARLSIAAWVPFALIILMENGWSLEAWLACIGVTLTLLVVIFLLAALRADVNALYSKATPPNWTKDKDMHHG